MKRMFFVNPEIWWLFTYDDQGEITQIDEPNVGKWKKDPQINYQQRFFIKVCVIMAGQPEPFGSFVKDKALEFLKDESQGELFECTPCGDQSWS